MKPGFDETVDKQIESEVRTIKAEFVGRLTEESLNPSVLDRLMHAFRDWKANALNPPPQP